MLLIFFRQFVELPVKNQPLLDYFWDISRDWERLQRTTTQLCIGNWLRLQRTTIQLYMGDCLFTWKPNWFIYHLMALVLRSVSLKLSNIWLQTTSESINKVQRHLQDKTSYRHRLQWNKQCHTI